MASPRTERFKKRTVWFHWTHSTAFTVLVITGVLLFTPGLSDVVAGTGTRIVHHIAATLFVGSALLYIPLNPRGTLNFIKDTLFRPSKEPESKRILQPRTKPGQRWWQAVILLTGVLFTITGALMWFSKETISSGLFQWCSLLHGAAFVILFLMFLVHLYRQLTSTESAMYSPFGQKSTLLLEVNYELCVKCKKCQQECPMDILISEAPDPDRCLQCLACVKVCPKKAISYREISVVTNRAEAGV